MAKGKDFHCYRDIIGIDASYSFKNGTGVVILDGETHRLKKCDLIRPFAPGLEEHEATIEISEKVRLFWEKNVGFSFDPDILCIEYPDTCFTNNGFRTNSKTIIMLGILCARIESKFHIAKPFRPSPRQWKNNQSKESTAEMVNQKLCAWSKKVLKNDLSAIPKYLHHNIYDAIGLALWAIEEKKKKNFN